MPSMKWISVNDKLPEPGERVIATNGAFVGEFFLTQSGEWRRDDGFDWCWANDVAITHWMPFPKP